MSSQAYTIAKNTGSAVRTDPAGSVKVLLFLLLGVLLIFVVFKFLKGFSKATELISDFGPSTESEKQEVISNPIYTDNLKWLTQQAGPIEIGKTKKYKDTSEYLIKSNSSWDAVNKAADQIWKAKMPLYISETEVYNAISSLPTKAAISLMALSFNHKYSKAFGGMDLNIFLSKYLKLSEMDTLTKLISKKKTV